MNKKLCCFSDLSKSQKAKEHIVFSLKDSKKIISKELTLKGTDATSIEILGSKVNGV